jgi:hypothetical protein
MQQYQHVPVPEWQAALPLFVLLETDFNNSMICGGASAIRTMFSEKCAAPSRY